MFCIYIVDRVVDVACVDEGENLRDVSEGQGRAHTALEFLLFKIPC